MPVVFNVLASLVFGEVIAMSARSSAAFRRELISWPLIVLVAFHAVIAAPMQTFLLRFYPQWSTLYAFDPQVFPVLNRWMVPLCACAVFGNLLASCLGLFFARAAMLRDSMRFARLPLALAVAAWIVLAVNYYDRVLWVGTYEAYWQGDAYLFATTAAGWVGLMSYAGAAYFACWIARRFSDREPLYV